MKTVKLKDLVDFSNGYAFKSTDYVDCSNTVNCRMSNIRPDGSFDIEYNIKYLPDEFAEKYSGFILNDGDIIIAMTDMAGDPKILGVPTLVDTKGYSVLMNQRVGKLTLKSNDIHPTYLKYYLMSNYARNYFKSFAGGGVQLNIGQKEILNIDIKLCNIKEQIYICDVFDKINALIRQKTEQLEKFDQLVKSRFIELFGDCKDYAKFEECIEIKDNLRKPISSEERAKMQDGTLYPYYGATGQVGWINAYLSDFAGICIAEDCGNYAAGEASSYIVSGKIWVNNHAHLLKCRDNINIYFLNEYFRQTDLMDYVNGATRLKLTQAAMKSIPILCPPIELQQQFAVFVEQTDKSKLAIQKSLDDLEELKKSLMQKYFG